jgi:hypothetical protein
MARRRPIGGRARRGHDGRSQIILHINAAAAASSRMSEERTAELDAGHRFAFGENWSRFLAVVDDPRFDYG